MADITFRTNKVEVVTETTSARGTIPSRDYWQWRAHRSLATYVPPVLIVIGTILNLLTIVVLIRRKFGKSSTRILLITLALSDTAVLWTGLLHFWLRMLDLDLRLLTNISCPLHIFCTYFFLQFACWTIMLLTFERWVSVSYPLKARVMCTMKYTCTTMVIVVIFLFALNSHMLYYIRNFSDPNGVTKRWCSHLNMAYVNFWYDVWNPVDLIVRTAIPFTVISLCNSAILYKVIKGHSRRKLLSGGRSDEQSAQLTSMTYMLTTVSSVFLLLMLPIGIFYIVFMDLRRKEYTQAQSMDLEIASTATHLIMYLNNTINFILYCVSGSQFRREVYRLFKREEAKNWRQCME
jgi:hypothetical protein